MAKFITNPVAVEAEQFKKLTYQKPFMGKGDPVQRDEVADYHYIDTPAGRKKVNEGDWIIRRYDVCAADEFEATHEPISDPREIFDAGFGDSVKTETNES